MNKLHDPELEGFKRRIDLAQYAEKAGYERRERDGAHGLTVLDHQNGDRIVVARSPLGPWVYASVPDYALRGAGEPEADALSRMRHSIERSADKGSIVEFVEQRDPRTIERVVPLETVRGRLRAYGVTGLALDFEGALAPPPYPRGRERAIDRGEPPPSREAPEVPRSTAPKDELNRRRYDWDARPEGAPRETEVERRLRFWREAQVAIEARKRVGREGPAPTASTQAAPPSKDRGRSASPAPPVERKPAPRDTRKAEMGRCRIDWGKAPPGLEELVRGPRGPGRDRER